jgi:hypothetical protein
MLPTCRGRHCGSQQVLQLLRAVAAKGWQPWLPARWLTTVSTTGSVQHQQQVSGQAGGSPSSAASQAAQAALDQGLFRIAHVSAGVTAPALAPRTCLSQQQRQRCGTSDTGPLRPMWPPCLPVGAMCKPPCSFPGCCQSICCSASCVPLLFTPHAQHPATAAALWRSLPCTCWHEPPQHRAPTPCSPCCR